METIAIIRLIEAQRKEDTAIFFSVIKKSTVISKLIVKYFTFDAFDAPIYQTEEGQKGLLQAQMMVPFFTCAPLAKLWYFKVWPTDPQS